MFRDDEKLNTLTIVFIAAIIVSAVFLLDSSFNKGKINGNTALNKNNESSSIPHQTMKESETDTSLGGHTDERVAIYGWVDNNGNTHFSDKPAINKNKDMHIIYVDPDLNIVRLPKPDTHYKTKNIKESPLNDSVAYNVADVYERLCKGFSRGSIKYRNCRSGVHKELKKNCFSLRGKLTQATGDRYQAIRSSTNRICSAYEKYAIID